MRHARMTRGEGSHGEQADGGRTPGVAAQGVVATVIMVGYNGLDVLPTSLASLVSQDLSGSEVELLYVDNASSDGSAEYVESAFSQVRVVKLRENLGFYGAFNMAASRYAQGRYLVALPQDALLHRRWLSDLVRTADDDENALVCVTNTVPPGSPDFARQTLDGVVATTTQASVAPFGYVRVRTVPFTARPRRTLAAAGVSGLLRRELVGRAGGYFDPGLSHYAGDVELGLRAVCVGGEVVQVPTAVVYHIGETSRSLADPGLLLRFAAGSRDQVLAFWQNMTTPEFVLFLPFLTVGLALKSFELRCSQSVSIMLFLVSLPLAPAVVLAACLRMPPRRETRRRIQERRTLGRFGLLRVILRGEQRLPSWPPDNVTTKRGSS